MIQSGSGNGKFAKVTNDNRLTTEAESAPRQFFISRDSGQAYSVVSLDAATADAEETFYIKNTSTSKTLLIDKIEITANAIYIGRIKFVTATATGTDLTAVNLNEGAPHTADAQIKGNGSVTGTSDAGLITVIGVPIDGTTEFNPEEALRLGQGHAIAVESKSIASVAISCQFHFESAENK